MGAGGNGVVGSRETGGVHNVRQDVGLRPAVVGEAGADVTAVGGEYVATVLRPVAVMAQDGADRLREDSRLVTVLLEGRISRP